MAIFALAIGLILVLAFTWIGDVMLERFTNLYYEGLTEETTLSRVFVFQQALMDIPGHLFFGNGTASFNLSFDWAKYVPGWAGEKTWIGNAPLRILHDTGLLGLSAVVGFFASVWWKARQGERARGMSDSMLVGLQAGVLLYCISFQSTDGTILAFFWVHLGLLASAALQATPAAQTHILPAT